MSASAKIIGSGNGLAPDHQPQGYYVDVSFSLVLFDF